MKYLINGIEFTIVIVLLTLSIVTFNKINQVKLIETEKLISSEFHLAIITDDVDSYAYDKFISGVDASIDEFGSIYEIYEVGELSLDDVIEMVIITEVDGVIFRLSDNALAIESIDKCKQVGIPVATVGNDAPESLRDFYIGTNKFNLGRHAANLAIKAIAGSGNIGIVLGSEYVDEKAIATNNFVNGIQDIVTKADGVSLTTIAYTKDVRAELLMDALLDMNEPIDVLICTDPVDVNRIIRVLVDRNRVGDLKIVASGDTPEILDGIQKNLITASIVEDYTELGALSVFYLNQVIEGERVSTYINVPFETIHQSNLGLE